MLELTSRLTLLPQLGIALGFVLPAVIVKDQDNKADFPLIGHDLFVMFLSVAIFTTVLLLAIVFGKQYWKPYLLRNLFVRDEKMR